MKILINAIPFQKQNQDIKKLKDLIKDIKGCKVLFSSENPENGYKIMKEILAINQNINFGIFWVEEWISKDLYIPFLEWRVSQLKPDIVITFPPLENIKGNFQTIIIKEYNDIEEIFKWQKD